MNTANQKAVTGEGNAPRFPSVLQSAEDERHGRVNAITQGRTIWNSDGTDGPCLICAPSFEDVRRMAGFPFDDTIEAVEAELDEQDRHDDTRTLGLSSDESEVSEQDYGVEGEDDRPEENDDDESDGRGELRDAGRSFGQGESYAERNA